MIDRARDFSAEQATKAVSSFACKECESVLVCHELLVEGGGEYQIWSVHKIAKCLIPH